MIDDALRKRLEGLAAYLPVFEAPDFDFGRWSGGERRGDTFVMPYFALSDEAMAFLDAAERLGWVVSDFDWAAWKETPEAIRLRDDPDALAGATPEQLARLLTVCIRQERFVEGALESAFTSGLITGILRRVAVLASTPRD